MKILLAFLLCTTYRMYNMDRRFANPHERFAKEVAQELRNRGVFVSPEQQRKIHETLDTIKQHIDLCEDMRQHANLDCAYDHVEHSTQQAYENLQMTPEDVRKILSQRLPL